LYPVSTTRWREENQEKNKSKRTATSSEQVRKSVRSRKEASPPSSPQSSPPAVVSRNAKGKGRRPRIESSPPAPTSEQEEEGSIRESEPERGNSEENDSRNESDGRNDVQEPENRRQTRTSARGNNDLGDNEDNPSATTSRRGITSRGRSSHARSPAKRRRIINEPPSPGPDNTLTTSVSDPRTLSVPPSAAPTSSGEPVVQQPTTVERADANTLQSSMKAHFTFLLTTSYMFPNATQRLELIGQSCVHAQSEYPHHNNRLVTQDVIDKIAKEQPSRHRNLMKNLARRLVSEEYGFQMEPCDENVEKAHELLDKMNFYFMEWRNPQARKGRFRTIIFQKLIEHFIKMPEWAKSWATVTASEFRKILPKMICFVATLIEHILESYASVHYQFSSAAYRSTYESHLQDLGEWLVRGRSANDVWNDICIFYEDLRGTKSGLHKRFQRIASVVHYDTDM